MGDVQRARGYQRALFEVACKRNVRASLCVLSRSIHLGALILAQTVAFLPTGSGKTLIASLLINHYANAVVVAREAGLAQVHIIFLARELRALPR
jgi:hypothetical protein